MGTNTPLSVMDNRDNQRKKSMIPRYMGAAASIEALTELQPVPDDREDELLALAASEASEASLRTRTPTTGSAIQRSGSGLSDNRRTSKTTTSYGADGSRITSTTSTYSTNYENSGQQSSRQNW